MSVIRERSRLSRLHDDLNMIAMIGTSDGLCWLAEFCQILFVLQRCRLLIAQYCHWSMRSATDSEDPGVTVQTSTVHAHTAEL